MLYKFKQKICKNVYNLEKWEKPSSVCVYWFDVKWVDMTVSTQLTGLIKPPIKSHTPPETN